MKNIVFLYLFILTSISAFSTNKLEGSPIGSNQTSASKAFDGNESSLYVGNKSSYSWVGLDLESSHMITEVRWKAPMNLSQLILLGVFQGANKEDFSDAVPIAIIDDLNTNSRTVSCSRGFRYVRYVGPADSYSQIAEVEFYGEEGAGDDSGLWQITNLPTVSINTLDGEIPYDKEHDISCTVIIISKKGSDVLEKSETSIRERGNASRGFPKKPWRIKFDKKQNVLDAPAKAKKWTLINNYGDKTLMRNMLAFDVAKKMGMSYVPFCTPVDVVLNGEYKGCYQLCDQVEVNVGRVKVEEMMPDDISGDALTGGYLVEVDGYAYEEPVWFSTPHYGLPITVKSPDDDKIVAQQLNYLQDYFKLLEDNMYDTDPETGYRKLFDNTSFIQHMLVNEVAGNTDLYWSTYMYKQRNDPKIYTGPVWDFDLGFNNDYRTFPVTSKSGNSYLWNSPYASGANGMEYFASRILLKDESTANEILNVWRLARRNGLSIEWLQNKVDEYAEMLDASQKLNFMRWPILNSTVHMNPKAYGSYAAECMAVKDYISVQMPHLDRVIGYDPFNDSGIEEIYEVNGKNIKADYYTITGIKVEGNLNPGIYIERIGNKSRKVVIK